MSIDSRTEYDELQAIMRRAQKLLAIAADTRANPAEAVAAARMAERIMRKYQIDHAELLMEQLMSADSMHQDTVSPTLDPDASGAKRVPGWSQSLAVYIAEFTGCQSNQRLTKGGRGYSLNFMGFRSDVVIAVWLYRYIVANLVRCTEQFVATHPRVSRAHTSSFRKGYVAAVSHALHLATLEKQQEMQSGQGSRALVVAKDQAIADHFGNWAPKSRSPRAPTSHAGFAAGVVEGRKLDVKRRAVNVNESEQQLLLAN